MGMWDNAANRQFAKDESGRLVFLPRGRRRDAYIVEGADENKFKSLVKVYLVAAALVNLTGSMASIGFAQSFTSYERPAPLAHQLKFGLVAYAITFSLFYLVPALLLWNVYRRAVDGLCSSLTTVDPASLQLTRLPSSSRQIALLLLAALMILGLGIFLVVAVAYRR